MLENVRGLSTARFAGYREQVLGELHDQGYVASWQVLNACEFGCPAAAAAVHPGRDETGHVRAFRVAERDRHTADGR